MREATADATVLIDLAKLGRLEWLRKAYEAVVLPEAVFQEVVVAGKARGEPDALVVEQALAEGWMRVAPATAAARLQGLGLDRGDVEVLSLALARGHREILTDDRGVRVVARALGIQPRGTLSFLLQALREGDQTFDEYLATLERLMRLGFRLRGEVYVQAVRMGRRVARR